MFCWKYFYFVVFDYCAPANPLRVFQYDNWIFFTCSDIYQFHAERLDYSPSLLANPSNIAANVVDPSKTHSLDIIVAFMKICEITMFEYIFVSGPCVADRPHLENRFYFHYGTVCCRQM